jgi:hypothetical protein
LSLLVLATVSRSSRRTTDACGEALSTMSGEIAAGRRGGVGVAHSGRRYSVAVSDPKGASLIVW